MAGYSTTPLAKKLGIKEAFRIGLVNSPKGFKKELDSLPAGVEFFSGQLTKPLDLIILFADSEQILRMEFPILAEKLTVNGMLWVSWPKKASGRATDLSENKVRQIGLDQNLVDVKVCAIDDVWSGLKFVYRLKDRKAREARKQ